MRWLIQLGGGALAAVTLAAAEPGYLATVGPPPLRFAAPPRLDRVLTPLPPLLMEDTNLVATMTEPPPLEARPPVEAPVETNAPPVPLNILGANGPATNLVAGAARDLEVIPTQMWMKYFTQTTNGPSGTALIAPIGFLPPQPITPPSSKSAFQTGP